MFEWDKEEVSDDEEETRVQVERLNPNSKLQNFNTGRILVSESKDINECLKLTKVSSNHESSKVPGSKPQTPLTSLKNLQGSSPSSEAMTLTYQDHFPRERSGLRTMKHTKPRTQESSNKNVSGPATISNPEQMISSVPIEVKTNKQESKINKLTKLVQTLMDEKIISTQKPQEPIHVSLQPESSKLVNSSKQSQDSKSNGKNPDSYKPVRPKPLQKHKLKCELCNYTNHLTDDCYRILYYMKYKRKRITGPQTMTCMLHHWEVVKTTTHNLIKQPGPNVVFGDNSSCITEGYCLINYGGIVFSKSLFLYQSLRKCKLDMAQKAITLEFQSINKLAKQNKVLSLPSLTYSKNKPCSACEKGKHKRASFKTKQNFSIMKYLHLLHMNLFGHVSPMSINHEKYALVIVDEYSRWLRDQHIKLGNIIGDPREGMLTRSMTAKLTAVSASECLFADFLSKIEPKKVFKNKKDEHGIVTKNKARLVAQGYSQEEGIDYDQTFAPVARMEAIMIFLAIATYMNFIVFQIDVKNAFLNGKLKEEVYVKHPPGFKSIEFLDYVLKTLMVPPNNLGHDLACKLVNETLYRGMIRVSKYLKVTPSLGLYYPKCSRFKLKGYSDSDYACCNMDRKAPQVPAKFLEGSWSSLCYFIFYYISWYQESKFLIKMPPRRSEGEELEYPFFEGDDSSSVKWRDYGVADDEYKGPPDFVKGLPYHGDSSYDDLVGNSRTDFVYPWENDAGPSVEEQTLLFLEEQDFVKKKGLEVSCFVFRSFVV
uniref:Retrovirus-related Pol polyprotein from transposon TNT 1-94 n=1 Tax=Tanacetum cinerariifolium TaxID=118510 RepID=A0A6L2MYH8_TANCI|nr:retrovirus-related Pol polyprotein from transposon TNT 1-94 [Tanacetum cinerariifolium]